MLVPNEQAEGVIPRARTYVDAGADMIFPEALVDESEFKACEWGTLTRISTCSAFCFSALRSPTYCYRGAIKTGLQRCTIDAEPCSTVTRCLRPDGDLYFLQHASNPKTQPCGTFFSNDSNRAHLQQTDFSLNLLSCLLHDCRDTSWEDSRCAAQSLTVGPKSDSSRAT